MDDAEAKVIELIFGSWRSQLLYAGVQLGVFDALRCGPVSADQVARELQVDARLLYRLMRALGSLELVHEDPHQHFTLTPLGEVLRRDHPQTLRGLTLLEAGPEHAAAWMQLPVFSAKYPPVHVPGKGPQSLAGAPPPKDVRGRSAH